MRKKTGLLLVAILLFMTVGTVLHGCGSNQDNPAPNPAPVKFTIVGSGS